MPNLSGFEGTVVALGRCFLWTFCQISCCGSPEVLDLFRLWDGVSSVISTRFAIVASAADTLLLKVGDVVGFSSYAYMGWLDVVWHVVVALWVAFFFSAIYCPMVVGSFCVQDTD